MASLRHAQAGAPDWRAQAREIQDEFPALAASRSAEQAVVATFLHSQPIGGKANTPALQRMAGAAADGIELAKALRRWREVSWFLDDEDARGVAEDELPKSWRLGNRPNLKQMHEVSRPAPPSPADLEIEASQIQDLAERVPELLDASGRAAAGR